MSRDEYFQTYEKIVMSVPWTRLLKIKMSDPMAVDWGGLLRETVTANTTAGAAAVSLSLSDSCPVPLVPCRFPQPRSGRTVLAAGLGRH